jgi:hypothetical protein
MKTREQILSLIKNGELKSETLDGRDFNRLIEFFPVEDWETFGFKLNEGAEAPPIKEFSEKNIISQMERDVSFGFDKALNQRGISSGLMYEVVKMWLFILDDELFNMKDYAQYGLPLFKAVAVKYGFNNPE